MKLNNVRSLAPVVLAALAALAVSACGGNDDEVYLSPLDPTMIPSSALANATAFSNYLASLPASDSDDPLVVSAVLVPTSDTDEPVAVTR